MKIRDFERAALAKAVVIDEIRCREGEVIICRGRYDGKKVVFDDEGRAFSRGGRPIPKLDLF